MKMVVGASVTAVDFVGIGVCGIPVECYGRFFQFAGEVGRGFATACFGGDGDVVNIDAVDVGAAEMADGDIDVLSCILAEVDVVFVPWALVIVAGAFVGQVPFGDGQEVAGIGVACRGNSYAVMFANVCVPVGTNEESEH